MHQTQGANQQRLECAPLAQVVQACSQDPQKCKEIVAALHKHCVQVGGGGQREACAV
jgi:hypothetical protein